MNQKRIDSYQGNKFHPGDRVLIVRSNHPWAGMAGKLTGEWLPTTHQYVIELDNGLRAAAHKNEVMLMSDITVGGGKADDNE